LPIATGNKGFEFWHSFRFGQEKDFVYLFDISAWSNGIGSLSAISRRIDSPVCQNLVANVINQVVVRSIVLLGA